MKATVFIPHDVKRNILDVKVAKFSKFPRSCLKKKNDMKGYIKVSLLISFCFKITKIMIAIPHPADSPTNRGRFPIKALHVAKFAEWQIMWIPGSCPIVR